VALRLGLVEGGNIAHLGVLLAIFHVRPGGLTGVSREKLGVLANLAHGVDVVLVVQRHLNLSVLLQEGLMLLLPAAEIAV
jgi:hypothetical protein